MSLAESQICWVILRLGDIDCQRIMFMTVSVHLTILNDGMVLLDPFSFRNLQEMLKMTKWEHMLVKFVPVVFIYQRKCSNRIQQSHTKILTVLA